jgi:hypothetical protein
MTVSFEWVDDWRGRDAPVQCAKRRKRTPQRSGASMGSPSPRGANADHGIVFFIDSPPPAGRASDSASALAAY